MTNHNSPGKTTPPEPTIDASEPEQSQRLIDALQNTDSQNKRIIIGLPAVTEFLSQYNLAINETGFIINKESNTLSEPVTYSSELFHDAPQPNEYSIHDYLESVSEIKQSTTDKLHVSDLHTIARVDGKPKPVADNTIDLTTLHRETGLMFTTITAWSDSRDITTPKHDKPDVIINASPTTPPTLSCLRCSHTTPLPEWNGADNEPLCPNCSMPWNADSVNKCMNCNNKYAFSELHSENDDILTTPGCPTCSDNTDTNNSVDFTTKTRYNTYTA
jgi:DNA-directed RNA polymerase subunit RPC12/RpoP